LSAKKEDEQRGKRYSPRQKELHRNGRQTDAAEDHGAAASEDRTDDELQRIVEAIDRVWSKPKDKGKQ
jgi:hypothetical protein